MQIPTSIEKCFKKRYGNTISETKEAAVNVNADEGGHLLLDVSRILNCNVWFDSTEIAQYTNHLSDFRQYFDCFKKIAIFNGIKSKDVKESFQATILVLTLLTT